MFKRSYNRGFTLIELMVALVIVAVIIFSFFSLFSSVLKFVQIKKIETNASALATEQMEIVHNISYDNIGTIGGIPVGTIAQSQTILRNGTEFTVDADVRYVDDPYDGILGEDVEETLNIDYKQVKITISWDGVWGAGSMFFLTNIAPKGIESDLGGGTLKLNVFDAVGAPVPQAFVDVENTNTGVSLLNMQTNNNGTLSLPGTPEDVSGYKIIVDKPGFSQARNYALDDPTGNVLPDPLPLSVFGGAITEASFVIDSLASLTIQAELVNATSAEPLSLNLALHGNQIIGKDVADNNIYKYPSALNYTPPLFQTDASGAWQDDQIEYGAYTITFASTTSDYNIISYNPPTNPVSVLPGSNQVISFRLKEPYSPYTLLMNVTDENSAPLIGANVRLENATTTYDQTIVTGPTGQSFFDELLNTDYDVTVTSTGYSDIISTITIEHNEDTTFQMFLTP